MRGSKLLLVLAGILAGLLAAEAGLRAVAPQVYRRPPVWEYDAELGWRHIPGAAGWLVSPEFSVEYRINAFGLRGPEIRVERDPDRRRVLCFGDSFAEGWGVRAEDRVSEILQDRLPGSEVINFGVAGYGTDQEWLLFEKRGRQFRPDWVVLFFYGNDLWNNAARQGIGAERGFKPFFLVGSGGGLQLGGVPVRKSGFWESRELAWHRALQACLGQHLHLVALVRKVLAPEIPAPQQERYYQGLYGVGGDQGKDQWELTGRLLQAFAHSVEGAGGRMLLVYVPALVQIEAEDWRMKRELHGLVGEYDLRKPQRHLQALALSSGIPFLDLDTVFAQQASSQTLYYRDSHWNPAGHALAAAAVAAKLEATSPAPSGSRP